MTDKADSKQIRQMAEEIFELQKLSWLSAMRNDTKNRHDLSESEFLTLDFLTKNESLSVGEIQRSIGVLPAQMSRVIRSLENKANQALVECRLNPHDKRKIDVSLTAQGRKAHQAYQSARMATTIGILTGLDESDLIDLMRIMRTIKEKLVQAYQSAES
jgi:DNA-binding MarR family transcriptional regulator